MTDWTESYNIAPEHRTSDSAGSQTIPLELPAGMPPGVRVQKKSPQQEGTSHHIQQKNPVTPAHH
jgi:hypothetical protein